MVKKKYVIIAFMLGLMISMSGVYAATTIIKSKDVSYDKSTSGGKYDNVQDAIDELYEKSGLLKDTWIDKTLNGADPVLDVEGSTKKLIPITLDDDGTVHYANLKTKWYDYNAKKWANAVILVDNPKNGGEENYTYKTGDIINEKDIESYFVWIPRYSYKIWNLTKYTTFVSFKNLVDEQYNTSDNALYKIINNSRIIDVKFGDVSTNPRMNESEATLNEYYTHPAFTLGDKNLNGIWVGKFETGYNQNGNNSGPIENTSNWTAAMAQITGNYSNRIIIKPNVNSWRNNTIKNFFLSSFNYARELESHMMKNTEWGAVAYLSHSEYGIGTEIRINNTSDYKTGYSAAPNTDQSSYPGEVGTSEDATKTQPYNSPSGYLASTTGNIYGVYDMSGGAGEYVAAYVGGQVGNSGFEITDLTNTYKNYFDAYDSNPSSFGNNSNRILGDATGEMGPFYGYWDNTTDHIHNSWYADTAYFPKDEQPWFRRSLEPSSGVWAGAFCFSFSTGAAGGYIGSRLVLSIK